MTQPMTQPSEPLTNEPAKAVLRVFTDRSRCCGYGLCAQVCPQVYKLDADGLVYLDSDIVPPGLEEEAREGAAACPAEALRVEFA